MLTIQKRYSVDLAKPMTINHLGGLLFTGDKDADTITVDLYKDGAAYAPGGTVTLSCIRADGQTVEPVTGSLSGSQASATLTQACCAVAGPLVVCMKITNGDATATVWAGAYTVIMSSTGTTVDPGTLVTDISALVAQIAAAVDTIPLDYSDLQNATDGMIKNQYFAAAVPDDGYVPFYAESGDSITVRTLSGNAFAGTTNIGFYDKNLSTIANLQVSSTYGAARTTAVTLSEPAYYVKLLVSTWDGEELVIVNNSNLLNNEIKNSTEGKIRYSLYSTIDQSANFISGAYIALNVSIGSTVSLTPVTSTQRGYVLLPCRAGDSFVLTATGGSSPRAWGFTDSQYKLLSVAGSGANASALTLTAESDGYLIVNHDVTKTYSLSATQLIKALSAAQIQAMIDESISNSVVVDAGGSGDYTSFTLACKENYGNDKTIIVKPGTYDIVSEYVAIWGQSAVDNMADADGDTFDGFQYGVKMNGRKFVFEAGAKLVCDWTGHTVDGTHRYSALRVEMDVEIEGLDLDCTATFYAIHDDYGVNTRPYTVCYKNCRVIGHSLNNANCIGGGCKKWSKHVIENCYFDNGLTGSATVRYHNTNADGAVPEIYVSNSYFNNWFTPRWYGTQTTKMRVYVNNCEARAIYKTAESSSYTTDNVDLYKWCCTETNPVT